MADSRSRVVEGFALISISDEFISILGFLYGFGSHTNSKTVMFIRFIFGVKLLRMILFKPL